MIKKLAGAIFGLILATAPAWSGEPEPLNSLSSVQRRFQQVEQEIVKLQQFQALWEELLKNQEEIRRNDAAIAFRMARIQRKCQSSTILLPQPTASSTSSSSSSSSSSGQPSGRPEEEKSTSSTQRGPSRKRKNPDTQS